MPHEQSPDTWPQPDYFAEALKRTDFTVQERYRALKLRRGALSDSTRYIVLPVQTQAFAFGPEFRALVAADLDRRLAAGGAMATTQTDVADAYGPFVRRFDDETVRRFAAENASRTLVGLYLGHDGIDQAFVDLTVGEGATRRKVHRNVTLPPDALGAWAAIVALFPEMLAAAGLPARSSASTAHAFACGRAAWTFADPTDADDAATACHALAVGALLPVYDSAGGLPGHERMMTPAHLAWLARAYVGALPRAASDPGARGVADLSLVLLGLAPPSVSPLGYAGSADPVVSSVARLLSLNVRMQGNPAASSRDLFERSVDAAAHGMPPFAEALLHARADFSRNFERIDRCALDRAYPGAILQNRCGDHEPAVASKPRREPSASEVALYQDWRIAAAYKDAMHEGRVLGRAKQTSEVFLAMPADIAAHPFVQRLRYELDVDLEADAGATFDAILESTRARVRRMVQATVDLQRNDRWMAGYSLTEHSWSKNSNVLSDPQVRQATRVEERMLTVLGFDRFVPSLADNPPRRRFVGSPAVFLEPGPWQPIWQMLAMAPPMPAMPPPVSTPAASAAPPAYVYKRSLFEASSPRAIAFNGGASYETLMAAEPMTMEWRGRAAVERLQLGASVADAVRLFNERPVDSRSDSAVSESHAWAVPGHVFFLSGELAAARPFYDRVRKIGSGSDSDLIARVRVDLIDGRIDAALAGSRSRLARYGSDTSRRDLIGLLFLTGQTPLAWATFLERAAAADNIQPWIGAAVGHRMEGATLPEVKAWIAAKHLDQVQIDYREAATLYLHLMAVVDRLPQDADIALLREKTRRGYTDPVWALSALLQRSALGAVDPKQAYAQFKAAAVDGAAGSYDFLLPLYAWTAGQAAPANDEYLDLVRRVDRKSDFDRLLAKSMLLAIDGKTEESLQFLRAARYAMAMLTWGDFDLPGRPIPAEYQYALGAYLMHRKTGEERYRSAALEFARNRERASPASSWPHALAALIETDPSRRVLAACRARSLDPGSYFLSLAKPEAAAAKCPRPLW